jgi:hypothetical protein
VVNGQWGSQSDKQSSLLVVYKADS